MKNKGVQGLWVRGFDLCAPVVCADGQGNGRNGDRDQHHHRWKETPWWTARGSKVRGQGSGVRSQESGVRGQGSEFRSEMLGGRWEVVGVGL